MRERSVTRPGKEKESTAPQFARREQPTWGNVEGSRCVHEQVVLLDQKFIRDPNVKVSQLIAEATAKMGENITVGRFARFKIGESAG